MHFELTIIQGIMGMWSWDNFLSYVWHILKRFQNVLNWYGFRPASNIVSDRKYLTRFDTKLFLGLVYKSR